MGSKCEVSGCVDDQTCFHYCSKHHQAVCMEGASLKDLHDKSKFEDILALIDQLQTPREREELFREIRLRWCECGGPSGCRCWNDE